MKDDRPVTNLTVDELIGIVSEHSTKRIEAAIENRDKKLVMDVTARDITKAEDKRRLRNVYNYTEASYETAQIAKDQVIRTTINRAIPWLLTACMFTYILMTRS
jgi:hypothetical protein